MIKDAGAKAGIAITPGTSFETVKGLLHLCNYVMLMSVNPGFGGQKFIPNTFKKIAQLREMITRNGASALIEVDGGVNQENAPLLRRAGADVLVAGSSVFNSPDMIKAIQQLKYVE